MRITLQPDKFTKTTSEVRDISWEYFLKAIAEHDQRTGKEGGGFIPASFLPCKCGADNCPGELGHSLKVNVDKVYMIGFDFDKSEDGGDLTDAEALRHFRRISSLGLACAYYTTHSYHSPDKSTWRLFFPLSRPITRFEFIKVWRATLDTIGIPSGIKTDNPARFWYLPSCEPGADHQSASIPGAPLDVSELLRGYTEPEVPEVTHEDLGDFPKASEKLLRKVVNTMVAHGPATEGEEGDKHTFIAAKILINDYALTHKEAWPIFRAWNQSNLPPWDERELQDKLTGNYATEQKGLSRILFDFQEKMETPQNIPEAGSFGEVLSQARTELVEVFATDENTTKNSTAMVMTSKEIMSAEYPPTPWLVDGIITQGGVGVIGGEPKTFKTWAAVEIALAVANGDKAFGQYGTQKGAVYYYFAEDLAISVRNRLRSLCKSRGEHVPDNFYCQPRGRDIDLCNDESLALLLASAKTIPNLSLMVLDPFRDIHSAKEDSSDEMSKVMRRLRVLGNVLGCSILFVHHTGKSGADTATRRPGQRLRGSSAIHGATDSGMYLSGTSGDGKTKFKNQVYTEVKGARSAGKFNLALELTDGTDGTAIDASWEITYGDPEALDGMSEVIEAIGNGDIRKDPPLMPKDILKKIGGSKSACTKALASAESQGYVTRHMIALVFRGYKLTAKGQELFAKMMK